MSKYTIEFRKLFEPITYTPPLFSRSEIEAIFKDYSLSDYLTDEQIDVITNAGIWSKDRLAKKIVDHYYMREIGFETIGQFIHYAKITMEEIMEEYLPLIYSSSISYDPLINVNYTEELYRTKGLENSETHAEATNNTGSSNSASSSNASSLGVNSDTPQGQITKASILDGTYATSTGANENESQVATTSSNSSSVNSSKTDGLTSNENENYTKTIRGNSGVSATSQKMIEQYRNNIRAIDREIIEKLNILFMGLY